MSRLPKPGSDSGVWGNVLNDFLGVAHNSDGTLKPTSVTGSIADSSITNSKLATNPLARANHTGTQTASTISDFNTAASTAAPVQSVDGATGAVSLSGTYVSLGQLPSISNPQGRLFKVSPTNAAFYGDLPGTTISAIVKLYTVPANYWAYIFLGGDNTSVSTITANFYIMADAVSTPVAADRIAQLPLNTLVLSNVTGDLFLDAGQSLWGWASANPGFNALPAVNLVPKSQLPAGMVVTPTIVKNLSDTSDQALYTVGTSGHFANVMLAGIIHNTTGSAISVTVKVHRAATNDTIVVQNVSIAANGVSTFMAGNGQRYGMLLNGDTLYAVASASGINIQFTMGEQATA